MRLPTIVVAFVVSGCTSVHAVAVSDAAAGPDGNDGGSDAPLDAGANVPVEYADLYASLDTALNMFGRAVDARWDGTRAKVAFSAELLTANANRGQQLLAPGVMTGVRLELDRLVGLGVQAVTFNVSFPLLFAPFHRWSGTDAQAYLSFYREVVAEARARGLRVAIETGVLFPGVYSAGAGFDVGKYYPTLTAQAYEAGRAEVAAAVASELLPDWLSIGSEPDTEATLTGQPVDSPAAQAAFAKDALGRIMQAGTSKVVVGAGIGTWQARGAEFVRAYCGIPQLAFVDLHVYPLNLDFPTRTLAYADAVHACGKDVALLEAWLLKERDAELSSASNAVDPTVFARDPWSFWAPLDQRFLTVMAHAAHLERALVFSAFWSRYFWAYLDYEEVRASGCGSDAHPCTAAEILARSTQASAVALVRGVTTSTGGRYYELAMER